jgi:autotransporter-associated beta strand protein
LGVRVGGAGEWGQSDITALTTNATFAAGAILGMDTSDAPSGSYTYSGVIPGSLGLNKLGSGALVLPGANTYSGSTFVTAGTLQIGNGASGESLSSTAINVASGATIGFNMADSLTYSGMINGAGNLIKMGTGTLNINSAVAFTGSTVVSQGVLQLSQPNIIYNGQLGLYTCSSISINSGAEILVSNYNSLAGYGQPAVPLTIGSGALLTMANGITSATSGPLAINGGTLASGAPNSQWGSWSLTYDVTANGATTSVLSANQMSWAGTRTFTVSDPGGTLLVPGTFAGSSPSTGYNFGLTKAGPGLMVLSGSNTYGGNTVVSAGILQIGNGASGEGLSSPSISVSAGALLAFNQADTLTYSGSISGAGGFEKSGAGLLVLSGTSSYSGGTTVDCGTLDVTGAAALPGSGVLVVGRNGRVVLGNITGAAEMVAASPLTSESISLASVPIVSSVDSSVAVQASSPAVQVSVPTGAGVSGSPAAVPEPGTIMLLLVGAAALAVVWRRRKGLGIRD